MLGPTIRLQLLIRIAGNDRWESWLREQPDMVCCFRAAIGVASAWVWRRHRLALQDSPWRLMRLADHRVDAGSRADLAKEFVQTRACCMRPGFARRLKAQVNDDWRVLLQSEWRQALLHTAYAIRLGIAGIERRHGWNRRLIIT